MNHTPSKLGRLGVTTLGVTTLSTITLVSVYLLILVGGIVRSTGSGMGCPDWPRCFGKWVPPTEAKQLPADYKEVYSQQRAAKNERFASYLGAFGFAQLADQIRNDTSILEEEDFNATKTWIEYLNRLMGALVGVLILATFVASLRHWQRDRWLVGGTFATPCCRGSAGVDWLSGSINQFAPLDDYRTHATSIADCGTAHVCGTTDKRC